MIRVVIFFSLWLPPLFTSAQLTTSGLDSLFNRLAANQLAKGSIAITQNGELRYQRSVGSDQLAQTQFRVGSITKIFTAVLVYQLIEAHQLRLTDKLSRFFPDLANAHTITIAQLVGHRSGLASFTNNTDYDTWKDQPKTHAELLTMIKTQKPDFEPDARADYNNSNYLLLSYILEQLYRKPYKAIVTEKIIQPLALKHTYYGDHAGFQPQEAVSYKYVNQAWKADRAAYLDNFSGAGAILSTPGDLCQFITSLFSGRLISQQSLDTMKQMQDGYGKGLFPYGDALHPGYGHNGKTEGFAASLQYYPQSHLAIAYCTNGEVYPKAQILQHVFKACFGMADTLPTFKPIALTSPQLEPFTGRYGASSGMEVSNRLDSGKLLLSLKGQDFELTPIATNEFWNKAYGFFFRFANGGQQLMIHDVDAIYELTKR